jgi:hypothetical protein
VLADKPDMIAHLEHTGRERALIYKTLVLTGLRKDELASLTVGQLELDSEPAYAVLHAADEKNRQGSEIPLWSDLADDLRQWVTDKLEAVRGEPIRIGAAIPARLPASTPLFYVPKALLRILNLDMQAAGIPKSDERGRTVDIHAMRHTFGTHLSKGGVAPRTAQAAMRHSSIDLTMNTYTDPKLLDVAGALDALPVLPVNPGNNAARQVATGTHSFPLVPTLVPDADNRSISRPIADRPGDMQGARHDKSPKRISVAAVKRKTPADAGRQRVSLMEPTGIEPTTSALRTQRSPN